MYPYTLYMYMYNQRSCVIQVMRMFCNDMTVKSIAQSNMAVKKT